MGRDREGVGVTGGVEGSLELVVVVNNVSSPQRLIDFAKLVYGLTNLRSSLVFTRVSGMAAQTGIPEVGRYLFRLGKPLLILPTPQDVIDLLKPDKVLVLAKTEVSKDIEEVASGLRGKVALVVNGGDTPPSKTELSLGDHVMVGELDPSTPPQAALAITLYVIAKKLTWKNI
ncbi:MAG: RecB-family nuclease [Desulfurococcaceae archaeon]|jgi:SpoU rRNA methylase family enzyme|nr:RecB-family nuclease [Desulfurococcaceae archaeon]